MTNDEIIAALKLADTAVDEALEFARYGSHTMAIERLVAACKTYNQLIKDLLVERIEGDRTRLQIIDALVISLGANESRSTWRGRLREYLRSWLYGADS